MAGKIISNLQSSSPSLQAHFGQIKHQWATGHQVEAFNELKTFAPNIVDDNMLKARSYQKLGEWRLSMMDSSQSKKSEEEAFSEIVQSFKYATELDSDWYKVETKSNISLKIHIGLALVGNGKL